MTRPLNRRIAIGMAARLRHHIDERAEPTLPAYDPHSEALAFHIEFTAERIAAWKRPLPSWLRCELARFTEGVEWAQLCDRWDVGGQTPRVLNRFAYGLRQVLIWWDSDPDSLSYSKSDCPDDNLWADFDWDSGDLSPAWHIRFPAGRKDEERFNNWRQSRARP
jgi:hypothetical protein